MHTKNEYIKKYLQHTEKRVFSIYLQRSVPIFYGTSAATSKWHEPTGATARGFLQSQPQQNLQNLQDLQNLAEFQKCQLGNLEDFEKR